MSPPATVHHYISHSKPLQYVSKLLQYVSKAFPIRFPSPDTFCISLPSKIPSAIFFTIFTFSHFSLPNCYLPSLFLLFIFLFSLYDFYLKFHDNDIIFAFLSRFAFLYRVLGGRTHQSLNIFISKLYECGGGERTLKLRFLSPKSFDFYLKQICVFCDFLHQNCDFYLKFHDNDSIFAFLSKFVFFVSHNTKAYIFLVSLYCMQRRWKSILQRQFLSKNSTSMGSFSLFFGLWLNFFRLCQPYQTCSFFLIPILLGFYDFSRDKSFNFFGCSSFILFSKFLHYKKWKKTLIYKKLLFLSQTTFSDVPLFLGFMIFRKTKALIFLDILPLFCFPEFSHYKKIKFLCVPKPSIACVAFWLIFVCVSFLRSVVAIAGILDKKSADSDDRVANNQEATKLE
ncbi:hypothetical protein HKD37_10G027768 [Glycine soja]